MTGVCWLMIFDDRCQLGDDLDNRCQLGDDLDNRCQLGDDLFSPVSAG